MNGNHRVAITIVADFDVGSGGRYDLADQASKSPRPAVPLAQSVVAYHL
jgi:hypothetical protein